MTYHKHIKAVKILGLTLLSFVLIHSSALACGGMELFIVQRDSTPEEFLAFVDFVDNEYAFDVENLGENHYRARSLEENTCIMGFEIVLNENNDLKIEQLISATECDADITDITKSFQAREGLPDTL